MREQEKQSFLKYWLLVFCGIIVFFGNGCASQSAKQSSIKATATSLLPTSTTNVASTFPAFHDWRAVYLAPDGHFHAVSIDGKVNVLGPTFPGFSGGASTLPTAGASPDGHFIAFLNNITLTVYDMQAKTPTASIVHLGEKNLPNSMFWSPDSAHIALGVDQYYRNGTVVADITSHVITASSPIAGTDTGQAAGIYPQGWLNDHTLLFYTFQSQNADGSSISGILEGINSTTGAKHIIDVFPHAEQFNAHFALSPDGKEALMYTFPAHNQPFTPFARLIDITTGSVSPLPHKSGETNLQDAGILGAVWRPGTHELAVNVAGTDPSFPNVSNWLLNTDTGAHIPIPSTDFIQSWSPDGSNLVLSNAVNDQNDTTKGPFTLTAAMFDANEKVKLTKLTDQAMAFAFLGFIRSA